MNKPAFNFQTILLQPPKEFGGRFVRILVEWVYFVARLKMDYVSTQAFPYLDPLSPQII